MSERPWVYPVKVTVASSLHWFANQAIVNIKFDLKNVGHSPAAHVHIYWADYNWSVDHPLLEEAKVCDQIRKYPFVESALTIFPDSDAIQYVGPYIGVKDSRIREVIPVMVGCVDYGFEFRPEHHQICRAWRRATKCWHFLGVDVGQLSRF